jgi:hypothetical protein
LYTLKNYYKIKSGDEAALKEALVTIGPVSMCVNASLDTFYSYKSGVWDGITTTGEQCSSSCDHAIMLVGKRIIF